MLLAMSYSRANEMVKASPAGQQAPAAATEEFVHTNPMVAHVGLMMTRLIPFLIVMVL